MNTALALLTAVFELFLTQAGVAVETVAPDQMANHILKLAIELRPEPWRTQQARGRLFAFYQACKAYHSDFDRAQGHPQLQLQLRTAVGDVLVWNELLGKVMPPMILPCDDCGHSHEGDCPRTPSQSIEYSAPRSWQENTRVESNDPIPGPYTGRWFSINRETGEYYY